MFRAHGPDHKELGVSCSFRIIQDMAKLNHGYVTNEDGRVVYGKKKAPKTIDLTPSWQGMVGVLLSHYENGNELARDLVEAEFRKMAKAADLYNASVPK